MLKVKLFAYIFLLAFPFISIFRGDDDFHKIDISESIRSRFIEKSGEIQTIQCKFTQEKYISYLAASVKSEGNFFYLKSGSIRWEYTNPYQYIIIIKDGVLHVRDNSTEMNFKDQQNKMFEYLNVLIQKTLSGNVFAENDFETSLMESKTKYRLTLVPKNSDLKKLISKVDIEFDRKDLQAESIVIYEFSADNTTINFIAPIYNEPIDKTLFE